MQLSTNMFIYPQNYCYGVEFLPIVPANQIFINQNFQYSLIFQNQFNIHPVFQSNLECSRLVKQNHAEIRSCKDENQQNSIQCKERKKVSKERKQKKKTQLENIIGTQKDRNILSNSLKFFFKHHRLVSNEGNKYLNDIIRVLQLNYSTKQFFEDLNIYLPQSLNYIRLIVVKKILETGEFNFRTMLGILLRKFFTQVIYLSSNRTSGIKRCIRKNKTKAGRKILQILFDKNQNSELEKQLSQKTLTQKSH